MAMQSQLGENIYAEGRQAEDAGRNLQGQSAQRAQRFQNGQQRGEYPYAQQGSQEAQQSGAASQGALRQNVERRMGAQPAQPAPSFRELEAQGRARPAPPPPAPAVAPELPPDYTSEPRPKGPLPNDPMALLSALGQGGTAPAGDKPTPVPDNPDAPADPNQPYLKQNPNGRWLMFDPVSGSYSENSGNFKDQAPSEEILQKMYGMSPEAAKALQDPANWERYQQATFGDSWNDVKSGGGYGWSADQTVYGGFVDPETGKWYAGGLGDFDPSQSNNVWMLDEQDVNDPNRLGQFFGGYDQFTNVPNASGNQAQQGYGLQAFLRDKFGGSEAALKAAVAGGKRVAYNPATGEFEDADVYVNRENERLAPIREAKYAAQMEQQYAQLGADENEERKRAAGLPYTDRSGQTHYPWDEAQQPKDQLGMTQWNQQPLYSKLDPNVIQQFFNRRFGG